MNVKFLTALSLGLFTAISAYAGNPNVLSDAHLNIDGCLKRFENHIQENMDSLQADHTRSVKVERELEDHLGHQFFAITLVTRAYDYFAKSTWDWEHPLKEKTLIGKVRAITGRVRFLEERLYQLNELQKMQPRIADRIDLILDRVSAKEKTSPQEWIGARNALRNHEQTYYDFLGDQTRWRVYEQGLANNLEWNKTLGSVQEDFYRNLSCVTTLDQVKSLIPKSIIADDGNQLAEQAPRQVARRLSSQLSIDDLE